MTSLCSLFHCLTTLSVKNFFRVFNLNLPWHSLRPFPFLLLIVPWNCPVLQGASVHTGLTQISVLILLLSTELVPVCSRTHSPEGQCPSITPKATTVVLNCSPCRGLESMACVWTDLMSWKSFPAFMLLNEISLWSCCAEQHHWGMGAQQWCLTSCTG